jgi:Tfp pilus assembly protein PilZ
LSTQAQPRFRKRVPCQLSAAGHSYSGIVMNVSRGGLFVQTTAGARPGQEVHVSLNVESHPVPIVLGAKVVWKRIVGPQLRSVTQAGIGLQIRSAPDAYYAFVAGSPGVRVPLGTGRNETAPQHARPTGAEASQFRVRVKQTGGTRSRTLLLSCSSATEARRKAMAEVGEDWVILELDSL